MGSPEQHRVPQTHRPQTPIPFALPTASGSSTTVDPFAIVLSPTVTEARNNLDTLRAAAAASNIILQQTAPRGRGRGRASVRAQPCEVVEGSMKPSKTCKVFEVLIRDALRFLAEEIQRVKSKVSPARSTTYILL